MVRSGKDKVVCNSKIEEVYERLGTEDKTLITYDEVDHSIL
jgi:alpha-beta hydrolase superfamily lysophospholipase